MTGARSVLRHAAYLIAALLLAVPCRAQDRPTAYIALLHEQPVGVVRLDARFEISLVSAEPSRSTWLHDVVGRMNAKQHLYLDATPPPEQPRASAATQVGREDPRFLDALKSELSRYYSVTLIPRG